MAVTVVGAEGFVGRRLVRRLRSAGPAPWTPTKGDPELFQRDLGVVYYCAGLTADYDQRPFDTVEAHASLVSRLINVGRFERLVYLSSTRLYDGLPKDDVDEIEHLVLDPLDPRRIYDLSKGLGENLTLTRTGGRGRVARLANVYDWEAGSPGFLSGWLDRAQTEKDLVLQSSGNVARDYIHLDDVVEALIAIAASRDPAIVNVASGERVTNDELAQVFRASGWTVAFMSEDSPASPPNVSIARLAALGVRPRLVRDVVGDYLQGLAR